MKKRITVIQTISIREKEISFGEIAENQIATIFENGVKIKQCIGHCGTIDPQNFFESEKEMHFPVKWGVVNIIERK